LNNIISNISATQTLNNIKKRKHIDIEKKEKAVILKY